MKNSLLTLFILFLGMHISAQVTVYTECDYSGSAQNLKVRSYYNSKQIGLADNSISSVKISAGYKATIFTEDNMKGREVTLTEGVKCLPHVLNNAISSIIISKVTNNTIANNGNVSVYSSCNYKGSVKHLSINSYSDLNKSLGNITLASLQIPKGLEVHLYTEKNFKGKQLATYSNNQSCLSKSIQRAKSIKINKTTDNIKPQPR